VDHAEDPAKMLDQLVRDYTKTIAQACEDVITQLAAAGRALDRTGFALTASVLRQCLVDPGSEESDQGHKSEQVLLTLA
jgi:DNA-binding FrmR family transcriptional regulator